MHGSIWRFVRLSALTSVLTAPSPRAIPRSLREFLASAIGLDERALRSLDDGEPVTRVLPTQQDRDFAVFGAVVVNAPIQTVAAYLRDFQRSLSAPERTFAVLPDSSSPQAFSGLVMSEDDARALRHCHTGGCDFKLSNDQMARAAQVVHGDDDVPDAMLFEQQRLAAIVNAYRRSGNAALPVYNDYGTTTVSAADAFQAILDDAILLQYAPGLKEYLSLYPQANLAGAEDSLFWQVDRISGLKTTTTLNQRVVFSPSYRRAVTVAATKQIVADHYLEAALEIVVAVGDPDYEGRTYLMFVRQYRFDHIPRKFFVSLRGRVASKLRDRAVADLIRLESDAAR